MTGSAEDTTSRLSPELVRYLARMAMKLAEMSNPAAIQLVLEYAAPYIYQLCGMPVSCAARKQGTAGGNDSADCDWPGCGCDPYAQKVIDAIEESGWKIVKEHP